MVSNVCPPKGKISPAHPCEAHVRQNYHSGSFAVSPGLYERADQTEHPPTLYTRLSLHKHYISHSTLFLAPLEGELGVPTCCAHPPEDYPRNQSLLGVLSTPSKEQGKV
jgi:hypothetical protein